MCGAWQRSRRMASERVGGGHGTRVAWPIVAVGLVALLSGASVGQAATIHVDASASGANDGTSWANAYTDLRAALIAAASGDSIWVKAGTYKPTTGTDRTLSFPLKSGVRVYGGFPAGMANPTFADRNYAVHQTVLSGEIGSPGNVFDNSFHVVAASGVNNLACLDGFAIVGGAATGSPGNQTNLGGGIFISNSTCQISNCAIGQNRAFVGGGVFIDGGIGPGPRLVNCLIGQNTASAGGAAGGGLAFSGASPTMINCTVANNTAGNLAGGIFGEAGGTLTITNCIVWGNTAPNSPGISALSGSTFDITYSNVQGRPGGTGNFSADPRFISNDPVNPNPRLLPTSPCVDAGLSTALPADAFDVDGDGDSGEPFPLDGDRNARVVGGSVDMGAWESPNPMPPPAPPSNLTAMSAGMSQINLSWNASPSAGTVGYRVYRAQLPDVMPATATLAGTTSATSFSDTGLTPGFAYYYVVAAYDANGGESIPSNEADAITSGVVGVRYVNAAATDRGDGTTWATAFRELQDAIDGAGAGIQIWVAEGTYKPDFDVASGQHDGDRTRSFVLASGVSILGGFPAPSAGNPNPTPAQRDPTVHETILSGDLNGDDSDFANMGDNSKHVLTADNTNGAALLDGVIVEGGNADGPSQADQNGGGLRMIDGSARVVNCTFRRNQCYGYGGGLSALRGAPAVENCVFSGNRGENTLNEFRAGGGAHYEQVTDSARLSNCTFTGNASQWGGAFEALQTNFTMRQCVFEGNVADNGGAVRFKEGSPKVLGCTFRNNNVQFYMVGGCSDRRGGAIYVQDSNVELWNCLIRDNFASTGACGGGVGGAIYVFTGRPRLVNCILAGNGAASQTGGMAVRFGASFDMFNSTLTGSYESSQFAQGPTALDPADSAPTVTNCLIWGNARAFNGRAIDASNSIVVKYSIAENINYNGFNGGVGNITGIAWSPSSFTPLFDADFVPLAGSQPVGNGNEALLPIDTVDINNNGNTTEPLPIDQAGVARVIQGRLDMGAKQYVVRPPPPNPPTMLTATAVGPNQIDLSWTPPNSPDVASYSVYRSRTPGVPVAPANLIGVVNAPLVSFSDTDVRDGFTYYYVVTARDIFAQTSGASNQASATAINIPDIWHVRQGAAPNGDGRSWATAFRELNEIYEYAGAGDQVWVAAGTYRPDYDPATGAYTVSNAASFMLVTGLAMYGGFAGTETSLDQRDVTANVSRLSGDLGGSTRSQHVVRSNGVPASAVLDGFTISGGKTTTFNSPDGLGAGLLVTGGGPTIRHCTFSGNETMWQFGGGAAVHSGSAVFSNCTFRNNSGIAAGLYLGAGESQVVDSLFTENYALAYAAGITINGNATVERCRVIDNQGDFDASGVHVLGGTATIRACTFVGNQLSFSGGGGGALTHQSGVLKVNYCRFFGNAAPAVFSNTSFPLDATNNWWGCNAGPGQAGCEGVGGIVSAITTAPWLVMTHTANPDYIAVGTGQSTLLAAINRNSDGQPIAPANLGAFSGVPIVFGNAVLGGLSNAATELGGGAAMATFNAGLIAGLGSADATVDNQTVTATVHIVDPPTVLCPQNPVVTSAAGQCFGVAPVSATATGTPAPVIEYRVGNQVINPATYQYPIGMTRVDVTASNIVGTAACSYDVTIQNTAPIIGQGTSIGFNVQRNSVCPSLSNLLTLSASDPNGTQSAMTWSIASPPATGSATFFNGANTGAVIAVCYQPAPNQSAPDQFVVRVEDECGATADITVNMTIDNRPPVINQSLTVLKNSTCPNPANEVQVAANGLDTGSAGLAWSIITPPMTGSAGFIGAASGPLVTVCYQPNADQTALDSFTLEVSDGQGGTARTTIQVSVVDVLAPTITMHPMPQTACLGGTVVFSVSAVGVGPLSYEWRKDGMTISGATGSSLTINNVSAGDAGDYDCVVTSNGGSTPSNAATLTVLSNLMIIDQPSAQTACLGGSAVFNVSAAGDPPITYQWRKGGMAINGANSPTLMINPVTPGDFDIYDCVVTGSCGSINSASAALTVQSGLIFVQQPMGAIVCPGGQVTLVAAATGSGTIDYRWRRNGSPINGATGPSYTIPSAGVGDAGSYDVVATDACGSLPSSAAVVTVQSSPQITAHPAGQTVCAGGSAAFSVTAVGPAPLMYQWRKGGVAINGANSPTLMLSGVAAGDGDLYDCQVTSPCGSVSSLPARLTVQSGVQIVQQPSGANVCPGGTFNLVVGATSTGTLTFQWRKNGSPIGGATGSTLSVTNASASDDGSYDCLVSDACGSVTSSTAVVSVNSGACGGQPPGPNPNPGQQNGNDLLRFLVGSWFRAPVCGMGFAPLMPFLMAGMFGMRARVGSVRRRK